MRIIIHGAGSIGCYIGGKLAGAGENVVFYGRERIGAAVQEHGLTLSHYKDPTVKVAPTQVRFETTPDCLGEADMILLCVKSQSTADAAQELLAYGVADAPIISLQNGVSNVSLLRKNLPERQIAGAMVPYNVVNLGEGRFHCGVEGQLVCARDPATAELARRLNAAQLPTSLSDDIDGVMWGKLLINLNNALNMLSDKPLKQQLADRDYRLVFAMCITEGLDVLKKAGITPAKVGKVKPGLFPVLMQLPDWLYGLVMRGSIKIDDEARSSMWEDLQVGRSPEIDYINGALVALGREVGVETPVNTRIIELVKAAFDQGGSPGYTGAQLLGQVLGRIL